MKPQEACKIILDQLAQLVQHIEPADFTQPVGTLSHSTIGQHLRHTLEFFICFEKGFDQGIINYDKRDHDKLIESDKYLALAAIQRIQAFIQQPHKDKALMLEVGYDMSANDFVTIESNFMRELVYNIEHAVHHMAIMKIGIKEVAPYIQLPFDFGVAASTIRHKEAEKKAFS
ncbi:MAG: hypothetical protein EBR30_07015 [Cytophagia bacterium]|nr:hypothetical protein [Cytophagia bacterium]